MINKKKISSSTDKHLGNTNQTDQNNRVEQVSLKDKTGDAANNWLARNRNLVLRQTPVWAQSLVFILIGLGGLALVGGIFFRIDEVVTVQGQLKSIGGTVEVKAPVGGKVSEVLYKDGDLVEKGQLLVRFDTRKAADEKETLTRLIDLEEKGLISRLATLSSQREMLDGRLIVMEKKLQTKILITTELEKLASQGGFQKIQVLEQQDQVFELQKQLSEINEQINQVQLQSHQLRLETRKSIDQMRSSLKGSERLLQYQNIVAPINGVIFDPLVGVDGVVATGERMLSLVPQGALYAEIYVPNQDIGFVKTGQLAKVRVDAFPFSRYGELDGAVTQISADALPPDATNNYYRFPVKLKLNSSALISRGTRIPLQSGMSVTSNLKLRDKRVISLVSDLLVDQTDSVRSIRQQ